MAACAVCSETTEGTDGRKNPGQLMEDSCEALGW